MANESEISTISSKYPSHKDNLKEKEDNIKGYKKLTSFLVERKISQEEIAERFEYIQSNRLKSISKISNRSRINRQVNLPNFLNGLYCAKFSPNGEVFATSYGSGCIQLRNGETGGLRVTIRSSLETAFPVTCCRFHPIQRDTLYASSACGSIFMCNMDKIEFWKFVDELDNEINAIDINVSGTCVFSVGRDGGFRMYDAYNGKLLKNYKKDDVDIISVKKFHYGRIFAAKCHKTDANLVITGGWDDTVKIWDTRVGNGCIRSINGPHICGDSIDVQEAEILTGSWVVSKSLQIWDLKSGKLIDTIIPENRPVSLAGEFLYCAQYFNGDPYGEHALIGGSATRNVEVINLKTKKIVASYKAVKAVFSIDSYKSNIVYGGMDTAITMAEFN